jgi:TRAP transporter TAXI family solute receptor
MWRAARVEPMPNERLQQAAVGGVMAAVVVAIATGRMPRWLRITLVVAVLVLACGAGLFTYRYATQPTTLTVAVGSAEGDAARLMTAIAGRMAAAHSSVRLKILDKGTVIEATKAFSAGQADLATVRGDIGDLSAARTVVLVTNGVVLIVTPPGSSVTSFDDLKGKTVGVIGSEVNQKVIEVLSKEYDLERAKVRFKDLPVADIPQALKSRQVSALLVVMPLSEKYLSMLRNLFPNAKQKPGLIAIESAGAIAAYAKAFESFDLPKGTLRGSPPVPDDDLTTLRIPYYLVAKKTLSDDTVGAVTKAVMEARRELVGEYPLLAQIGKPETDKDAYVPVHPGAAGYFDGDQKTFFDKYGDQFFYGSMLLGSLMSLFAAAWKYMIKDSAGPERHPLPRLYALSEQVNTAQSEAELAQIEQSIDDILKAELDRYASGAAEPAEAAALSLATHRLEHLINQRRATFDGPRRIGAAS